MTESKPNRGWEIVGKVTTVLVSIVLTAILRGFVLSILWGWFVEPLGVAAINIAEAIGLATILGMLLQREPDPELDKLPFWRRYVAAFTVTVVGAIFALGIGWIVHFFV